MGSYWNYVDALAYALALRNPDKPERFTGDPAEWHKAVFDLKERFGDDLPDAFKHIVFDTKPGHVPFSGQVDHFLHVLAQARLMSAPNPERSPEMVRLYSELPLERAIHSEAFANGQVEFLDVPGEAPLVDHCRPLGDSLWEYLAHLIEHFALDLADVKIRPGRIVLCGGLGDASAMIEVFAPASRGDIGGTAIFSMEGGGCRPDDAPWARLDQNPSVPAEIFQVFRNLLAGESEPPPARLPGHTMAMVKVGKEK